MPSRAGDHTFDGLADVLSRRKRMGLAVISLTAAAGVTAALSLPSIYLSTATVLVEPESADTPGALEAESRLQMISQEILSRSGLEPLIVRFNLYPGVRRDSMEPLVQRMRSDIRTEFKLQPQPSGIGSTFAFVIGYRGTDPQTVSKVANALATAYIDEAVKNRERQARGTVTVLKSQLDEVERNLEEQERALAEFQDQHMGELPQESEANKANLDRLHADLRSTSDERIRALDRRNELLKELAEADRSAAASSGGPGSVAIRLAKLREELAQLTQRYSDKYPDVVRLREQVADLEKATEQARPGTDAAAGGASLSGGPSASRLREALHEAETEIKTLKSEEARLRAEITDRIRRLENAPQRQRSYQAIARDHQTTRDLYDSLRKRYEQAQLEEAPERGRPASPFRILDAALVPTSPVAPNRMVLLFVALVGSVVSAAAVIALAERLDTSLHNSDDVRSFTRVPVVAAIPRMVTAGDLRSGRRRAWLAAVSLLLCIGFVVHTVRGAARTSEGLVSMLARGRP
jgi:polysaccharide biosynthesis transport protein